MGLVKTEGLHVGEAVVFELPGSMSRAKVTILSGQNFGPNRVLGKITASGKYVAVNPAASDGSQVASAVGRATVDAATGDKTAIVHVRLTELNGDELDFGTLTAPQIVTAKAQLEAATLFVREAY